MRTASITRKTSETDITMTLNLDGSGMSSVNTGIGFFDHMLKSFAKHGFFDLNVNVKGDLIVDCHHTIEDTGIVLGEAVKQALGDKKSIRRYGSMLLPMDETLVMCAIDLPDFHSNAAAAVMELTTILPSNQQSVTVKSPSNLAPTIPPMVSHGQSAGFGSV